MFIAKIENSNHEILELTGNEANWQVVSITGLNPPPAQINTTAIAGMDGAKFNSSKLETRNLVITLKLNGGQSTVETNRQQLYRFFRTKDTCRFYFRNTNRDVFIDGLVETCEVDLFELGQAMQISIICPQPYFKAVDEIIEEMSSVVALFVFPFAIDEDDPIAFSELDVTRETDIFNDAEAETGAVFTATFAASVSSLKIVDTSTGETFQVNYNFVENDILTINTNKGEKSVSLLRSGVRYNLFGYMVRGSIFFQLLPGDNYFRYEADGGTENINVFITVTRYKTYRGV